MRFFGFFLKDRLLRRGYMALDGPTATNEHHPDRLVIPGVRRATNERIQGGGRPTAAIAERSRRIRRMTSSGINPSSPFSHCRP
ncbi:Hypothetical protein NTJ_02164 [Nesidiocoris tenuis]|uniref:Uncharacterized protein n=1 Tax=Nesidiocoris tenuis TaxID=355587 RepID=A0ABN7ADN8_9HEMI|nr:Hypothetical protein NTJ_02164 [Nesidiocoris tenuis]